MADTIWLYSTNGKPAYYQNGKYLYSADKSTCDYYYDDQGKYVYRMNGGGASSYRSEKWLYTMSGEAKFYYS